MPTALALSPHLDDAVFSAGGTLYRLARTGWRVVVATVFTASVTQLEGFALACQLDKGLAADIDYMALRRAEDAAACDVIGAEPVWLPFVEAPHRGYESAEALFAGLHEADTIVHGLKPAFADLLVETAPDLVLAPQAIGGHVDHIAVVLALQTQRRPTLWWTDHPYATRPAAKPSVLAEAFSKLPVTTIALSPAELAAKGEAVAAYRSQLAFQFGGAAGARAHVAAYGRTERMLTGS